jgi:hypothetical protein
LNRDDHATGQSGRRGVPTALALGLGVLVLAVLGFVLVKALGGDEEKKKGGMTTVQGPPSGPYKLDLPPGWRALRREELATLPGRPLGVLRRNDGKGFVVVRREGPAARDFAKLSRQLDQQLARRLKDFKKQSARTVKVRAGRAFFYSYVRKRRGTVHSIVIVPAGGRSYALNTVAQGGENAVAREIGRIVVSFDL